ncbi:aminoglycoside adenylyltransferase family protein [Streptomyces sp. NPDC052496]|uniref:aminoglycoside adenylyltransferase family protein n=1 Tax=Streptomyces sp. NPDC052496 TaxID=3154951 RepID=UPI0034226BE6
MDQRQQIVESLDRILGPDALGVHLHGSSVLGGLRPASDLDILVVSRRRMSDRQRQALVDSMGALSGFTGGARPVELTVVVQDEVRPWRFPPTGDFLYGEWLRDTFTAGAVPQPAPMPELALLVTMTLAGDHPLAGPPPARLLDPVPWADVVRASVDGIPGLLAEVDSDTRNVLLTLARIWTTLATGDIRPKDAAADWARGRLPPRHRPVLQHAKELYLNCRYEEENWSEELKARVRPHVDHVLAEIERLTPG